MKTMYSKVILSEWIDKAIGRLHSGWNWERAWIKAYYDVGGEKASMAAKRCPMNTARILYETGRLKNTGIDYKVVDLTDILKDSINGVYALIAIDMLQQVPHMSFASLVSYVHSDCLEKFGRTARSDQGAIKIVFILCKLGKIQCN